MDKSLFSEQETTTNSNMESDINELINNISTDSTGNGEMEAKAKLKMERFQKQNQDRMKRTNSKKLSDIIKNISTDSTDSEGLDEIEEKSLKDVKTYYIFYKELDKKFNICISNLKPKEYFACVMCDEDKDLIMEFENHFKYNADYIKLPKNLKYFNYRIHNLTKDKLKQEMDKFIKSLGIGYYLDYFSTVKNWTGKD